ncbi:hypothetical protein [Nitrobacter sp.]|uniref:hypothetical protein n=1 Tax=Nitrobacter sp. TaxID=29420 RepID=UPI003F652C46
MFQVSTGVLGALAVMVPLGAMHLPLGPDHLTQADAAAVVNRTAKSDRGSVRPSAVEGRTVSIRLESLPDASIVIQIPGPDSMASDRGISPRARRAPASQARRTIACEPVVSVLTDVAKQLQPGRCVT